MYILIIISHKKCLLSAPYVT